MDAPQLSLKSLHIYPVKSCRAVDLSASNFDTLGLENDRRWVVAQQITSPSQPAAYKFISQRTHPQLTGLIVKASAHSLTFECHGQSFELDLSGPVKPVSISIWGDAFQASLCLGPVNDWLSQCLGGDFVLVSLRGAVRERREPEVRAQAFQTSFADGYPMLIAATASLAALNQHVEDQGGAPLPMARFRPNIVIDTQEPWAEDSWKLIKIGETLFECVKPCARCIMTTLDPITGESRGPDAVTALQALRRSNDKRVKGILFGVNAIPVSSGRIKTGDPVQVIEMQAPWAIA